MLQGCRLDAGFKHLKKLSLGHNCLHAFPALKKLPALVELRLNGNKLLAVSPTAAQKQSASIGVKLHISSHH